MKRRLATSSRRLTLPRHRTTTAHLCSAYPFMAEAGIGTDGVYLGTNVLTGGAGFWFDPFEAYRAGLTTNPNMLVVGEPGTGKSTSVKTFVHRTVATLGRWVAVADPKGEYRPLADELGLQVIDLHPGGSSRLNPLDIGMDLADPGEIARQRSVMIAALLATVLHRDLFPLEDAAIGWIAEVLAGRGGSPTLLDVSALLTTPTAEMVGRSGRSATDLARELDAVRFGIGKLLDRDLHGMFDGPSTVSADWSANGVVIDLSGVHYEPDALAAVLVATTAWLGGVVRRPDGPPRLQVLDEAWCLLGSEATTRYLQSSVKLGRSFGVANLFVLHRFSDLRAQSDDGTAAAKIATGLLADAQTRVVFRQSSDQLDDARRLLGLNSKETELVGQLARGRALWKVGAQTAVVAHHVASGEMELCDTDARMRGVDVVEGGAV